MTVEPVEPDFGHHRHPLTSLLDRMFSYSSGQKMRAALIEIASYPLILHAEDLDPDPVPRVRKENNENETG